MLENEEQINSDAQEEVSSEPQESSAQESESNESEARAKQTKQSESESNIPFHKHERWIERENEFKAERAERQRLQQELQDLRRRMDTPAQPPKQDPLLSRLKDIDPEFGGWAESQTAAQKELAELKQWKDQFEQTQVRTTAVSQINNLHSENKVSKELQELYNNQLEIAYANNPKAFLSDIQGSYKRVHESISGLLDNIKRTERESYVKSKKSDSNVPTSQPKGEPVKKGKMEWSKDPDEARMQLRSRLLAKSKADDSI